MIDQAPTPARLVIDGCHVVTMDAERHEYPVGHVVVENGRIAAVGPGRHLGGTPEDRLIDASGCVVTPGLVNTHHHFYHP